MSQTKSSDINRPKRMSNGRQISESITGQQNGSSKTSLRIRSASVGRSRDYDLRCRYWAFLFDNLNRAVDEIYQNCEKDESVVECKEAIMVLDNYKREFTALIEWLNLNIDYESTPPPERPNSLTWEVRKSMPKQMTYWNTFFNKHSDISINNNLISKSFNKSDNHLNKSEEKENIQTIDPKVVNENQVSKPEIVEKQTLKPQKEEQLLENKPKSESEPKISDQTVAQNKPTIKTSSSNPSLNTMTTTSKPLNPLAISFKSRLHPMSSTPPTTVTSTPTTTTTEVVTTITTAAPVPQTQTAAVIPLKKSSTPSDPKTQQKIQTNSTNLTKRTVVSAPNLSILNTTNNEKNNQRNNQQNRRSEPKIIIPMINKNFIKETNSSRAKNVRNNENHQSKTHTRGQNNILSARNLNVRQNVNSNNNPKTKRVKDADGWEVVGRGRQRYKASPPKVIIVEDESLVKTTADGTVIAVTASSQTIDEWDPMCSSWNSQTDSQTELLRTPGKAIKLHEKLSSPSRKRNASPTESIKRHEEKLEKAREAREKFLEKKAQKFKGIVKKVEEMKVRKEQNQMQLKEAMERKLQRAEEKRQQQLNRIVRKAHDEDSKVNEILFINSLEAQNKKYDILSKENDREMRLQDLHEERQRKMEEKQAKEAAVEERRKVLEEERQQRIQELQQRRRLKDQKIEQQFQEKEKERQEMATQKALNRQSRLSAINASYAQSIEELQKKIQLKEDESKRRHEENISQIRQKAIELSVRRSSTVGCDEAPICEPYDACKMCQLCQVFIKSEVFLFGHLRGKKHLDAICEQNGGKVPTNEELENFNIKYITEAPTDSDNKSIQNCDNERLKAARKRSKKLKQRLIGKAIQYETNCCQKSSTVNPKAIQSNNKNKISKLFKDLNTLSTDTQITGQWPPNMIHSLERILNELEKIFRQNESKNDSLFFYSLNGIQLITKMLARIMNGTKERPTSLTDRANTKLAAVYELICGQHLDVSDYVLQSNNMIDLLDILLHRLNLSDSNAIITSGAVTYDPVIGALCRLLSVIFDSLYYHYSLLDDNTDDCLAFNHLIQDVISYIVSIGMIDKLSLFMCNTRGPIDEYPDLALFLRNVISFFSSISKLMTLKLSDKFSAKLAEDETQLMLTLQMTHICGVVSLIYGVLFHSAAPIRVDSDVPPVAAKHTLDLTLEAIRFLNYISLLDLSMIQYVLGGEGLSLQLRHICSYLLWYCSHNKSQQLLNEVILLIGNFVVLNLENQTLIQSGQRPTVVQQLCSLPFEYFSDDKLSAILFPTLIACCFNNQQNRNILEQEMSTLMLSSFIESTIVGLQLRAVDSQLNGKTPPLAQQRLTFAKRFPKNRWNEAKDYFECQSRSPEVIH